MSSAYHHSVKAAARQTGLSAHVIRIWERRYGAVKPERTDTQRRLYSTEQVERLRLLRALTENGHSIGDIATLPTPKLEQLCEHIVRPETTSAQNRDAANNGTNDLLAAAITAVRNLDAHALETTLRDANIALGTQGLALRLIAPLAERIGELWREGAISAAHEHFATAVIRVFLGHASRQFGGGSDGPVVIVVTPVGQLHELGALLAGLAAANLGWNVKYLGASLPAAEIAGVARQTRARAVALSIIYPEDDPRLENELLQLREAVGKDIAIIAGGRAAGSYKAALARIDAVLSADIKDFASVLEELRTPRV